MITVIPFQHPEQNDREMFLTNTTPEYFDDIGFISKRPGQVAYDLTGTPLPWPYFPVFVWSSEHLNTRLKK